MRNFILGPEVRALEREISQYLGIKHAVGVNSGTDALIYSLKAIGIKSGDEVICPVFTFIGTAGAVVEAGAKPVFADINLGTLTIDPVFLEKMITERTRTIIPVHLYGQPSDMDAIMRIARNYNLRVIEDAAQAFGAEHRGKKIGTIGDIGCLSFFPTKILGAFGDGGMVVTDNLRFAKAVRRRRIDGARKMYYDHRIIGGTSRLHEFQAMVLRVKFKYLKKNLEHRKKIANEYDKMLERVSGLHLLLGRNGHAYNHYVIRTPFRDKLKDFLAANGVQTFIFYPKPLHRLAAFKFLGYKAGDFPNAEKAAKEVLVLPLDEFLPLEKVKRISLLIKKFFDHGIYKK